MVSTRRRLFASACMRRSVEVSMRIDWTARASGGAAAACVNWRSTDGRVLRSRGSVDRQTEQSHPIAGTPWDVPLPSTVTLRFNNPLPTARRFDEPKTELVEDLLENLAFFGREVAAGLLIEERQDLDHLRGALEVDLSGCAG